MKEIQPIISRKHPIFEGIQKIYRFPNNYGASVVRFKVGNVKNPFGFKSYTSGEEDWELAVIEFENENDESWKLCYDTKITDDVIGFLTDAGVQKILRQIQKLKVKEKK